MHDPENSTYDHNFWLGMEDAKKELGLSESQVIYRHTIPESDACYTTAVDLIEEGCNIIFADSFGHESYIKQAAEEYPAVRFLHATGTMAHTSDLPNFSNAFAAIYEGRYLAGVAAGLKLQAMGYGEGNTPKVGYVGAFPYAEVKSGYTSWFLGVRSIISGVTMEVTFTNSWFDIDREKTAAEKLIGRGCVLISQHADSLGAPQACQAANVPNVSYNGSTETTGPDTFIISSRINWKPYLVYAVNQTINGEKIATDWTGTIATGSVEITELGKGVFTAEQKAAVQTKLNEVKAQFAAGTLHVFATANWTTKDGQTLTTYKADVDTDDAFTPDTEAISGGYFHESEYRSAPYFDIDIAGITSLGDYDA